MNGDDGETFSSRRRISIHTLDGAIEIMLDSRDTNGLVLAGEDDHCDFEIELSGITGNQVVRLDLADPSVLPVSS